MSSSPGWTWEVAKVASNETIFELDDRKDIETMFTSWIGVCITVISAVVSTLASMLVISLIFWSRKKLARSVYHRILFGMSIADIIQSIAMALTTLPMPTDMIYTGFQGLVVGNDYTCKIQGSAIIFGVSSSIAYNTLLSVYYFCSIQYNMTDLDFRRCLEPVLHAIALFNSLVCVALSVAADLLHPSPTAMAWCGVTFYPYWRLTDDNTSGLIRNVAQYITLALAVTHFTTIVGLMIMIVITVRKRDRQRMVENLAKGSSVRGASNVIDTRIVQNAKIIRNQAIAYSIVNLFAFLIVVICYVRGMSGHGIPRVGLQIAYLIFRPLQGLFNSCIFIYHKAYNLQRAHSGLSFGKAAIAVFNGSEADEIIFSGLNELSSAGGGEDRRIFRRGQLRSSPNDCRFSRRMSQVEGDISLEDLSESSQLERDNQNYQLNTST